MRGYGFRARPLTRDLRLLAGIAGVAGMTRVKYLLGAGQALVRLLWQAWRKEQGYTGATSSSTIFSLSFP